MNNRPNLPKNPLRRDGVSQRQRLTPALAPDQSQAAQVDERTLADFLAQAYRLSKRVNYYKTPEVQSLLPSQNRISPLSSPRSLTSPPLTSRIDGNWQDFFEGYAPVQIALISKTCPQSIKYDYDKLLNSFLDRPSHETLVPILKLWQTSILEPILTWYRNLESYTPFRSTIKGLVNTNLEDPVNQIIAFEQACASQVPNFSLNSVFYTEFSRLFQLQSVLTASTQTVSVSRISVGQDSQPEIDSIFQALSQVHRQIVHQSSRFLEDSLRDRQDHPPHLALYVAMLDVLQPARDDLNRMTQRHLDFFYKKVLQLPERPATPDFVHLCFELAKSHREYKLGAGVRFKAGKDDTGAELFYALDQAIVVHRASIASLQGLFLESAEFPDASPANIGRLLASPIANSADGHGEAFSKEQTIKAWLPFGGPRTSNSQPAQLDDAQLSQGSPVSLGVAIASDVLLLQEGQRTITLLLSVSGIFESLEGLDLRKAFNIYLSGEKEWILAAADDSSAYIESAEWNNSDSVLTIVGVLTAAVDPVLPYDPSVPIPFNPDVPNQPLALERPMPVLRLELTTHALDSQQRSPYHYFRDVTLSDLTVSVYVPEVRTLVVQTDAGVQDATKPFQPFGPRPKAGSALYIGSQEVFQKSLTELSLQIDWEALPENGTLIEHYKGYYVDTDERVPKPLGGTRLSVSAYFNNFSAMLDRRINREWSSQGLTAPYKLFAPPEDGILFRKNVAQESSPSEVLESVTTFSPETTGGFLRLVLDRSFLHDEFPTKFATQTLATAKNFRDNEFVKDAVYEIFSEDPPSLKRYTLPSANFPKNSDDDDDPPTVVPVTLNEPYTPVVQSLILGYKAETKLAKGQIFRLHPFGGFEQLPEQDSPLLFPKFINEGELLIGIAGLDPPTALPLLFQVAEETADTGLRRTEEFKPQWFYLKDNAWMTLGDRISSDTTHGLTRSGIINLGIPEDISKAKTTILDPTFHWIKVSMPARTRTVCHIIGVHAQAARATFVDQGNDPNRLAIPLPAETIAKLEKPQAAIKSVKQPYASVGGRVKEPPNQFYTRVSEHLRHKGRAVTIFDYERLVLEQFPDIYKVRCLNHGQFDDTTNSLFELAPGAVTVAVIPDVSQRATTNDLQPKVNINRLQTIEQYLTSLSSSWATVKAVNPLYETIQVSFEVKFKSPYDANFGYYRRELERAIVGFLTPWTITQGADIHFGGKVYRSAILNFVEEQEFVDYVVNFKMFHNGQDDVREAIASTAQSVLTSVPPGHPTGHLIQEYKQQSLAVPKIPSTAGILGYEPLDNLIIGAERTE